MEWLAAEALHSLLLPTMAALRCVVVPIASSPLRRARSGQAPVPLKMQHDGTPPPHPKKTDSPAIEVQEAGTALG
jgi:hypothetical protein